MFIMICSSSFKGEKHKSNMKHNKNFYTFAIKTDLKLKGNQIKKSIVKTTYFHYKQLILSI